MTHFKQHPAQINHILNEWLQAFPASWGKDNPTSALLPPVNIHETADGYHLELSVPGRNKEDFKVKLDKNLLTISFDKKETEEDKSFKTIRREYSHKSFTRSFTLDEQINAEAIQAKYEQGILKLFLPKVEKVIITPKEITIL